MARELARASPRPSSAVPSGLPQRMHWKIAASFSTRGAFASGARLSRGVSAIACSGQVVAHMPHWTHFASMKRSCGFSWVSRIAPSGHAADAGEAHRAGVAVDGDRAERRARRQRDLALRHRRVQRRGARSRARRSCACRPSARTWRRRARRSAAGHDHSAASQRGGVGAVEDAEVLALIAQRLRDRCRRCAICRASASRYCGASSPVASTATCEAPSASAASQTSSPTDAT